MNKNIKKGVSKDLKTDLENIEMNSDINRAIVKDVIYPDKKVNYNEEFDVTLVVELLNDSSEKISINCPKTKDYKNSDLELIQNYTGVKIYNFSEENVELPVKYDKNDLKIDYTMMTSNNKNKTKKTLTRESSIFILSGIYSYIAIMNYLLGIQIHTQSIIIFITTYLLFFLYSLDLPSKNKLFKSI